MLDLPDVPIGPATHLFLDGVAMEDVRLDVLSVVCFLLHSFE
jgi:hypothetical protein